MKMKKLAMSVFALALLAGATVSASAYEFTVGGVVSYANEKYEEPGYSDSGSSFAIAPEFAKIIDENTNVGIGLAYSQADYAALLGATVENFDSIGGYLFAERAILGTGAFKVFLRDDIGYNKLSAKLSGNDLDANNFAISITPNVQYALSDALTLTVSSSVLSLSYDYTKVKDYDIKYSTFGFNAGKAADVTVGIKYAF
jgi:outer membrane scaffolding protein for murein synthesis (MipA/OmpV family)